MAAQSGQSSTETNGPEAQRPGPLSCVFEFRPLVKVCATSALGPQSPKLQRSTSVFVKHPFGFVDQSLGHVLDRIQGIDVSIAVFVEHALCFIQETAFAATGELVHQT